VLHKSDVQSAADANCRNKRVVFKQDLPDRVNTLDVKPSQITKITIINRKLEDLMMNYQIEPGLK
jgi:hypothetical protein